MDDLDAWAEGEHAEWVQQKMSEECEEKVKKAKKQGAVEELKNVYEELTAIGTYYMKWKLTKELIEKRLKELLRENNPYKESEAFVMEGVQ